MDIDTSFGRWLRTRRRTLDLTQADLAKQVGCAVITIQKMEADERRPSRLLAERLATSLRLTDDERAEIITWARAEPYHDAALTDAPQPLSIPPRRLTTLPTPLTSLIGRKQDSAAVRSVLMRGETRLLTLLGPPGIGKTRLSIEVAHAVQAAFTHGAYFIALAPLGDPALVMATIAQTLGVKENAGQPLLDGLKSALQAQRLLLVLDNFEHLLAAAPFVVELLEACPGLKALVTSRAALHVRGERLVAVPPLLLPDLTHEPVHGKLARIPAVALFVERAQAVLPPFRLTAQNAAAVAAICVRLDGLPLAIELAATRVKLLPPTALLARLEQRLAVLTEGGRDLPPRHRTLRAAIAWSYTLLDDSEQRLFRRLGVFVGGCTLAGAEAVLAEEQTAAVPAHPLLDGLTALIDKSLLKQEQGRDGEPRLTMLETIREYALEQLALHGETETLRHRHADYYLRLAEEAEAHILHGPDQVLWSDRLEAEHDNLRAVLTWSCTTQEAAAFGLRLAGALAWFWVVHSHFSEGYRWLNTLLDRLHRAAPAVRAKILRVAGLLAENIGEFARTAALLEESLALYRALGDGAGAAQTLVLLGRIRKDQGKYAQARTLLAESLALGQAQQNTWAMIWGLLSLGDTALATVELKQAEQYFQQALTLCLEQEDRFAGAWAIVNLGRVAEQLGDDRQAQTNYTEGVASFRQLAQGRDSADVYLELGRLARRHGHAAQAQNYYAESLTVLGELRDKRRLPVCLEGIAGLASMVGQPARAAQLFGAADAWREAVGLPLPPVERATYERDLAAARTQLDEVAWTTAWAEGQTLSLEQAITEAQQVLLAAAM
ncbi:MAG: helix-turn-helix domain-containing protein [Caldilinea sp. CFX5]|nr:helix-turn-helix domain-containing protein [Caldilinea sp. CFX5]